jgi:ribosomal protein S18 acetylase RimI-like enzyme
MPEEGYTNEPLYRSFLSGEPLTLRKSRVITVSLNEIPRRPRFQGTIDVADLGNPDHLHAVEAINNFYWDSMEQDVFGRAWKITDCENYIAVPDPLLISEEEDGPDTHGIAGHVALMAEPDFLHIVVFHVWPQWHARGVGWELVYKSIEVALSKNLSSIKLGTTNDNIPALYFYQRMGFVIDNIVTGEVAREHGHIQSGFAGIPVRDEIQLRLDLT